jgi:hypothetical protein
LSTLAHASDARMVNVPPLHSKRRLAPRVRRAERSALADDDRLACLIRRCTPRPIWGMIGARPMET